MAQKGLLTIRSDNSDADMARTFDPHRPIIFTLSGPKGEKKTFSRLLYRYRYFPPNGGFKYAHGYITGPTDSVAIPAGSFLEAHIVDVTLSGWLTGDENTRLEDWTANNDTGGNKITAAGAPPSFEFEQSDNYYINPRSAMTAFWSAEYDWEAIRKSSKFLRMDIEINPQGRPVETMSTIELKRECYQNYGVSITSWATIPAGKYIGCDYVEIRVNFVFADSAQTGWSRWTRYTTKDTVGTVAPLSPIGQYVDGSKPIALEWSWNNPTGNPPMRAEFDISANDTDYKIIGTTQGQVSFIAAAGSLPSGNLFWRVRAYNVDNVPSSWSNSANIVVRQAPPTPALTSVSTLPRPIVSWQAAEQQGYQLRIGAWDSGTVYGTAKQEQAPEILPDGSTTVQLRVQNILGLWSGWAMRDIFVTNKPAEDILLRTGTTPTGITLRWTTDGIYSEYQILRDEIVVGATSNKEYTDYLCNGKHRYMVRGIKTDSTYTDSNSATEIVKPMSGVIAVHGVWDWLALNRRIGGRPARGGNYQPDFALAWYSGRPFPVAETTPHISHTYDVSYTVPDLATVRKLEAMAGKKVVYKHRDGDFVIGIMGGINYVSNTGRWDVSMQITEVDDGTML